MSFHKPKGLSVLEVLIAVTILLTGFLFLMGIFPVSLQGIGKARNLSFAGQLAQQNLETYAAYIQSYCTPSGCSLSPSSVKLSLTGAAYLRDRVNDELVKTNFLYQVSGSAVSGTGSNVISVVSWVRWREYGASYVSSPSGNAPVGGYGAHFLSYETWVYLP